jgi:spermidine synthase
MNVTVAVTHDAWGYKYFHGAGKVQASSNPEDMRLQRMLGHLAALMKKDPEDVLVVACGAGVTAGSFVPYRSVKDITICDIEPMVPKYVTPKFARSNHNVMADPRTHVVIDDGRHYVRTTGRKFDVITSDPIDPWVKGCAALNTVEYYRMCRDRLKPGGVVALWIPLYESSEDTAKSVIATFFEVFPNGVIWSNEVNGAGYDAVLFAKVGEKGEADAPLNINVDDVQAYVDEHPEVKASLREVGFGQREGSEAVELLSTYAGMAKYMKGWTEGTENLINRDSNLRLQYVAGLWVNEYRAGEILNGILKYYRYPREVFQGSPEQLESLKRALRASGRIDSTEQP